MTPHPQRCETCSHYGGHICYQQHNRMSNIELTLIEMVGCASHSSIPHTPAPVAFIQPPIPCSPENSQYYLSGFHDGAKAEREQVLEKVDNRIGDLHYKAQRDGMNQIATGLQQARNVIDNELESLRQGAEVRSTAAKEE